MTAKPKPAYDLMGRAEQIEDHLISPQNLILLNDGAVKASDIGLGKRSPSALNLKAVLTCLGIYNEDAPGARAKPGEYNTYLRDAVYRFQRSKGWSGPNADGYAGPMTVQMLARWAGASDLHWIQDVTPTVEVPNVSTISADAIRMVYIENGWNISSPRNMCLYLSQEATATPHRSWCANAYWDESQDTRVDYDGNVYSLPVGAIAIYYGGTYGHAVACLGEGQIISSDSVEGGRCLETYAQQPTEAWGMPLVGYVPHP